MVKSPGSIRRAPLRCEWYHEKGLRDLASDADWIVEQEAYFEVHEGKIDWLIVLCGGYHPADEVSLQPSSGLTMPRLLQPFWMRGNIIGPQWLADEPPPARPLLLYSGT